MSKTPVRDLIQVAIEQWNRQADHDGHNGARTDPEPLLRAIEGVGGRAKVEGFMERRMVLLVYPKEPGSK